LKFKWIIVGVLLAFVFETPAQADIFGGDVAVLVKILTEDLRRYSQLQQMLSQSKGASDYLRWLNAGIDNSVGILESLPIRDEKVLAEIRDFRAALAKVRLLYGPVPPSPIGDIQILEDQTVAESLRMANDFKEYSITEEQNSALIASEARDASPKGAARMQAEMSAHILKSLSQLIRLDTQLLKLQSEQMAVTNKQSKDGVANYQQVNRDLGSAFSSFNPDLQLVRF
jgi:hypothetical protein